MDDLTHLEVDDLVDKIGEVSRRDELLGLVGVILSTQSNLAGTRKYHEYVDKAVEIAAYAIDRVEARMLCERTLPAVEGEQ